MLSHCKCTLTLRKSQQQILDLVFGEKRDEKKLYIVSPPGSGKTITGLMIAVKMNVPVLVLVPNTAIQAQWIDKTRYFIEEGAPPIASVDPESSAPITVLTYQALAKTRDVTAAERSAILTDWKAELIEEGELTEDIDEWLQNYEEQNPDRFYASLLRRWKNKRLASDGDTEIVNEDALKLMNTFFQRVTGLVIFDECHHLLGYWAQVALKLVEILQYPRVLGLTATPPSVDDLTDKEVEFHKNLLHEIDYILPTPAVVKDGNLAPYQDLAYFTRPTEKELEYIRNCSKNLSSILRTVEEFEGKKMSGWLIEEIEKIPDESMTGELRRRSVFMSAAVRYLKAENIEVPRNIANFADGDLNLEEKADLVGRYAAKYLLVSGNETERKEFKNLSRAFRPLGFQLTEKGLRRCQSTVSRVIALSQSKMDGLINILTGEITYQPDIRAIVVTDFEKSSAIIDKEIADLLTEESGGAIAAMRALTSHEKTDELDPILVTGQSVLVDDDLMPVFLENAEKWFETRNLKVTLGSELDGGFYRINGNGKDWNTRNYVAMITELFEKGITHCLVGTRGLLGEGWDSLCANTLIDLTTAATDMTVNQLRGRAIRLNPDDPQKVANIWDVVCIAPEFEKGLSDYRRFAKKHSGYYGICDDGAIEYGLGHIHPALTEAGPEDVALNAHIFNDEMARRCADRAKIYAAWEVGTPYENVEMKSMELKLDKKEFANLAVSGKLNKMYGVELSGNEQLQNICLAVLSGIQSLDLLKDKKARIEVTERSDKYFRIFLDTASAEDMDLFSRSVNELFQPLADQRYIIPRYEQIREATWLSKIMPEVLKKYFMKKHNRIAVYHPLPNCFADSKKHAELFSDKWNTFVSPGEAVFAKRGKGEEMLVEAKTKKQSIQEARSKIKSVWK